MVKAGRFLATDLRVRFAAIFAGLWALNLVCESAAVISDTTEAVTDRFAFAQTLPLSHEHIHHLSIAFILSTSAAACTRPPNHAKQERQCIISVPLEVADFLIRGPPTSTTPHVPVRR